MKRATGIAFALLLAVVAACSDSSTTAPSSNPTVLKPKTFAVCAYGEWLGDGSCSGTIEWCADATIASGAFCNQNISLCETFDCYYGGTNSGSGPDFGYDTVVVDETGTVGTPEPLEDQQRVYGCPEYVANIGSVTGPGPITQEYPIAIKKWTGTTVSTSAVLEMSGPWTKKGSIIRDTTINYRTYPIARYLPATASIFYVQNPTPSLFLPHLSEGVDMICMAYFDNQRGETLGRIVFARKVNLMFQHVAPR